MGNLDTQGAGIPSEGASLERAEFLYYLGQFENTRHEPVRVALESIFRNVDNITDFKQARKKFEEITAPYLQH